MGPNPVRHFALSSTKQPAVKVKILGASPEDPYSRQYGLASDSARRRDYRAKSRGVDNDPRPFDLAVSDPRAVEFAATCLLGANE